EKLNDHTPMVVADFLKHHCAVEVLRAAGADEKELKKLQKEAAQRRQEYNRQFMYSLSPRGKCEAHCNEQYRKNTDSWKLCMDGCSDYRSDVIGDWP
ncbi:hypothetical protein IKQ19_07250, partial [Candidatus Saccharibacteria bacterium]|nr:hypothetical protein [Candidatus Saccharibacteria bacterium]